MSSRSRFLQFSVFYYEHIIENTLCATVLKKLRTIKIFRNMCILKTNKEEILNHLKREKSKSMIIHEMKKNGNI